MHNLQCSFTATVTIHPSRFYIDYMSTTGNRDNPLVKGNWSRHSSLRGGFFYPSGILVNVTRCPHIYPSCWIMLVTYPEQPCVDLWSGLTSSTHLCKCAWLGHCMIIWPCCRFIILSLSLWWGFLSYVTHILSFFSKRKKKKKHWTQNVHCHAYQVVCSDLSFFVSQVNTVKYIQWMIFNSYPFLVVLCNTLETMQ